MRRRYFTLDVFTTTRFAGNPLAVVLEAGGLETVAMQAIAREFNLPETVFVFPPADPGHRARLRIFTPGREIPFAGHPTVGTAVLLAHLDGGETTREIVLEEQIGLVICSVLPVHGGGRASFDIPKLPERLGPVPDLDKLAAALSLAPADIGTGDFSAERWTAGNAMTFVPVKSMDAVARARPDMGRWSEVFGPNDPQAAYVFCQEVTDPKHSFHARMFAPGLGVFEDPATGSAAAAFAGPLAAGHRDGKHGFTIEQGYEMQRPSLIHLALNIRGGVLTSATVGGDAVLVAEGTIEA
ncbi:PhzF family phenazine biosynthesis protein [Rhodoplanes sp. Z2-YC6860]|uniref:PhzF family phenazine biosynthesis protein n=1 Tax=Rhodoplanes sp. Z2-YC6860 TaxID=674703 RepID=UPI00078E0FF5|nr:PhzF family phenazine biosynthesis protein [Rhodoplanes sp. Z2-YC6860]AMN44139.1 PhzF family phenazine biosynthesis protein [Rhodoplanes sp. Z2-YC6860]